jgi:hypothetical protein
VDAHFTMPTKGGASAKSKSSALKSSTPKGHRPPDELKSPQPQLSDLAQLDLRNFLNKADKPFGIATLPNTKKRKREASTYNAQEDLWEDRLSVLYEVRPKDRWESLRRYKKFTGEWERSLAHWNRLEMRAHIWTC